VGDAWPLKLKAQLKSPPPEEMPHPLMMISPSDRSRPSIPTPILRSISFKAAS